MMRKRSFILGEEEIKEIRQAEQGTRDAYELKRLQAVRMYGCGEAVAVIQEVVSSGESTIRQWVMRYQSQGVSGLASQWQGGNANKLTSEQRIDLIQRIDNYTPDQVISPDLRLDEGIFWTVNDFRVVVEQWYGVTYSSDNSYYNLMRAGGLSYQKAEKVFRSQPSAEQLAEFEAELEKKLSISYRIIPMALF